MTEIENINELNDYIQGLKVIVFDLDDTLYNEKEYVRSGYRSIAEVLTEVECVEEKLWCAFEQKKSAIDEVLRTEGIYTEQLKQNCLLRYRCHSPSIHFLTGVKELLLKLRLEGYMLGVITDGRPEGQRAKIKALDLEKLVDYIIITDELGGIEYRKPNDTAFVIMKEYFDVGYEDMCYVGDNINKDFIAPEKLGMKCIWFRNRDGVYC